MANTKYEDAIMKMGFEYFRESILKRLRINYEFVIEEPTETERKNKQWRGVRG